MCSALPATRFPSPLPDAAYNFGARSHALSTACSFSGVNGSVHSELPQRRQVRESSFRPEPKCSCADLPRIPRVKKSDQPLQTHRQIAMLSEIADVPSRHLVSDAPNPGSIGARRASPFPFVLRKRLCHRAFRSSRLMGMRRRRLPVAAKTAFATAGAVGGTPDSPTPSPGSFPPGTM